MAKAPAKDTPELGTKEIPDGQSITDEDVMIGSPVEDPPAGTDGDDDAEDDSTPDLVDFEISGAKYQLPKAVLEHIQSTESAAEQARREAAVGKQPPVEERKPAPQAPDEQIASFFENPAEFIRKAMQDPLDGLVTGYRQEVAMTQFWNGFYEANKDLSGDRNIVNLVFAENRDEILDLRPAEAAKRLAEKSRKFILDTVKKHGGTVKKPNKTNLEAPSGSTKRGGGSDEVPESTTSNVTSLGGALRQRQRLRMSGGKAS